MTLKGSGLVLIAFGKKINFIADSFCVMPKGAKEYLNKNLQYKDRHKGKRAFVVANGPSIKEQDLSFLKNEITYTMSGIWKHPLIDKGWQPSYYCLADPIFFEEKEGFDSIKVFFENVRRKLEAGIFFVPFLAKKSIEKHKLLEGLNVNYILFNSSLSNANNDGVELPKGIPGVQSTAQMAIELAIYMGCSPIYLLGFDHDWLAKRGMDRHFYHGKTLKNHPKADGDLNKVPYKVDLEACLMLWQGYETLLKIAKAKNIQIINATAGGFLDVFPRQDYEKIKKVTGRK